MHFFQEKNDAIEIKQHNLIEYLRCIIDQNLTAIDIVTRVLRNITTKLKLLHRGREATLIVTSGGSYVML